MIYKMWNYLITALAAIVVTIVLLYGIGYLLGMRYYVVLSGSMEPVIKTGSLSVVNTKVSYDDIQIGDIIAFENSLGTRVTHRAIKITDEGIATKGDANDMGDGVTTTKENFLGETLFAVPLLGYFLFGLNTKKGIIILITFVVVMWIADSILGCLSEEKGRDRLEQKEDI